MEFTYNVHDWLCHEFMKEGICKSKYSDEVLDFHFFVRDHQGSVTAVIGRESAEQLTRYYPFGGLMTQDCMGEGVSADKYTGKRLDRMHGLDWYDFGARQYDPVYGRFAGIDPLCEKYPHLSPYAYCGNDPVNFVDPTGMIIEENSLEEWERLKGIIENKMNSLSASINNIYTKAYKKGWSAEKLDKKLGERLERVSRFNTILEAMDILEGSSQVYSLQKTLTKGSLTLNSKNNIIIINYTSAANFVHEVIHGGQFERGDIAFAPNGNTYFQDIYDEIEAYKAQYAFNPSSVSLLPSTSAVTGFDSINKTWIQGLKDNAGTLIYAPGNNNNTGIISIGINATKEMLIQAYPWNRKIFENLPDNYNVLLIRGLYYKK